MLTSKIVARKTGLSLKTLTRWSNQGIIPKPAVQTHPSGRGKIGYWPDSVLDRCLRIVQLRKQGHSLSTALVMLGMEDVQQCLANVKQPTFADLLAQKKVHANGMEVDLLEVFQAAIAEDVWNSVLDRDHRPAILTQLVAKDRHLSRIALRLMEAGYSPFLTFDGTTVRVRGRGITPAKGEAGDLMVTFDVVVPTRLTADEREAVESLADKLSANPRTDLGV